MSYTLAVALVIVATLTRTRRSRPGASRSRNSVAALPVAEPHRPRTGHADARSRREPRTSSRAHPRMRTPDRRGGRATGCANSGSPAAQNYRERALFQPDDGGEDPGESAGYDAVAGSPSRSSVTPR
jgi:hypothetical protein